MWRSLFELYVFSEYGASERRSMAGVYDPQANSWQWVASMPRRLSDHAAAVMGGKIYVTGGWNQEPMVNSAYVYDPQADAWAQLTNMGTARQSHASAVVGGKL